jgi:lipoprotein-releasing system permease protein
VKYPVALLVALRYFRTRRRDRGNASSLLSVLGIAVGVMTLTVVLAVMNGFQLGFIESIVEISSYHLQVRPSTATGAPEPFSAAMAEIRALGSVSAVVPFAERQALIEGAFQKPRACVIRAVPPDLLSLDPVQARMLEVRGGDFDLRDPSAIAVGTELAGLLGVRVGDLMTLTSYAAGEGGRLSPRRDEFRVAALFHTGYYDFDVGLVFMSLAAADRRYGGGSPLPRTWGVKLRDRFADARVLPEVASLLRGTGATAESWRTYNRSFFDALLVEKLMMMMLVGLIFLVVGFNVHHSLRRRVLERMEEIAVLKAVGIPPRLIQAIFVVEGALIGVVGGICGLAAGLALAMNINGVFAAAESLANAVLHVLAALAAPFAGGGAGGGFRIFSPTYFYLVEVPSRVLVREAFLVSFFAVLACAAAAWSASRAVARFRPAEVLRYE